jgi:ribosomal protein S19
MARSIKKGPYIDYHLLKKVDEAKAEGKREIKLLKLGQEDQQLSLILLD